MAAEDTMKPPESDHSSASPAASGSSDVREEEEDFISSAETTPPPVNENYSLVEDADTIRSKRCSDNSSSFSRSYQSAPSFSLSAGNNFSQHQQQRRPSSGIAPEDVDEEEASLVAAVESLCSFGTPRNGPGGWPDDVPPVPPVPARYREYNAGRVSGSLGHISALGLSVPSNQPLSDERNLKMGNSDHVLVHVQEDYDYDDRPISHGRSDEEDDGIFGAMEGVTYERLSRT